MSFRRASLATALAALALAALPGAAAANDLSTLDPNPVSEGHVIVDAAGNAYVAWITDGVGTAPEPLKFCKVSPGGPARRSRFRSPEGRHLGQRRGGVSGLRPRRCDLVVAPRYAK